MPTVFARFGLMIARIFRHALRVLLALVFSVEGVYAQTPSAGDWRGHIEQIAHAAQGRVGVAVTVLETGASIAVRGDQRFPMQSVSKLPIGMAVLQQVDQGVLQLAQQVWVERNDFMARGQHSPLRDRYPHDVALRVRDLLRFMVSDRDGTACDVLVRLLGGPPRVTEYVRALGVPDLGVATTETDMGRDATAQDRHWATPDALVAL